MLFPSAAVKRRVMRASSLGDIVREELNVNELRFVAAAEELGTYTIRPNLPALGPRFGRHMPDLRAAIAAHNAALPPPQTATSMSYRRRGPSALADRSNEFLYASKNVR